MPPTSPDHPDDPALALVLEGWRNLQLQRPLASWACWQRAIRLEPGHRAATEALDRLASAVELPEAARKAYRFRNPEGPDARGDWDAAFRGRDLADLAVAAAAFEELAEDEPTDAPAWWNRSLCLAWLGRNPEAIEALDVFVHLVAADDFEAAAEAWALAEVLRHGAGAEHLADDLSYVFALPWPDDAPSLEDLDEPGAVRPLPTPVDPVTGGPMSPDTRLFEWLDRPMPPPSPDSSADDLPTVRALVIAAPGAIRCSGLDRDRIEDVERSLARRLGREIEPDRSNTPLPLAMLDAAVASVRLPDGVDDESRARLTREAVERFYEHRWVETPRRGLGAGLFDPEGPLLRSPAEAAREAAEGDRILAAKLAGVVLLREQLARRPGSATLYLGYPFDRLRGRLGLEPLDATPPDEATP